MTPYKSYHELELENASLRAQLASAHTIVDSYAAEMREESLERDAIDWLADESHVITINGLCILCLRVIRYHPHEGNCLHLRAKAYKQSQKENGQ